MRSIGYEIKKITGMRYIWVILAILLTVNIVLCIYTTSDIIDNNINSSVVSDFFELYFSDSHKISGEYDKLLSIQEQQNQLWLDAMRLGNYNYEPEPLPNKYIESDRWSDLSLFGEVFTRRDSILSYPSTIQKVIDRAYANLAEFDSMNMSPNSYSYKYQLTVIDTYKHTQANVRMGLEYTRGWGDYFSYDYVNIFVFASLTMIASVVFAQEKNSGFLSVLRTSKHGRTKTALSKITSMMLISCAVVLAFTISTWIVFGFRLGYSNPTNAVQVFSAFNLCPFVISVGQYFIISIVVKLLVFMLFSAVVMAVSVFVYNYTVIYICGISFFGLNFLLYTLRYINADNPFKNLNFVAVAAVNPLFIRYRSFNLFGNICGYVQFMFVTFTLLLIALSAMTVVVSNKGFSGISLNRFTHLSAIVSGIRERINSAVEQIRVKLPRKRYSQSIFVSEMYKTLISSRYILIAILLIGVKVYISSDEFQPIRSYSDAVYKEYMTELEGELTDEKIQYINEERLYISTTLSKQSDMQEMYANETITYSEYREYLSDYQYAYSRDESLKVIEAHQYYIQQTESEKDVSAWFVYDTGWKKLLYNGFDVIQYAVILLLFAGIFADEYSAKSSSGSFVQILRTTKHGRNRTFRSKLMSAIVISSTIALIFNAVDLILIQRNYGFPAMNAHLLSIETFSQVDSDITIFQYLILFFAIRIIGSILLSVMICSLSELLRKSVAVMSVTVGVTLFPALLRYFGLTPAKYVDFTGLMTSTQMFMVSANMNLFGDMGFVIVFTAITAIVVTVMSLRAKRTFNR